MWQEGTHQEENTALTEILGWESILSLMGSNRARPCRVRSQWICIEALTEPAQLLLGPTAQSFCPRGSETPVHSGQGQGDGKAPQVALSCDKDPSLLP